MRKTVDTFAGRPTGARRNREDEITHIKFSRRMRAMPMKKALSVIRQGQAEGIRAVANNDNEITLILDERILGMVSIEDLPEI